MEYLNIVPYDKCTGCGMCMNICPKNAIELAEDEEGFLYPHFDKDQCVSCGLCEKYCTVKQSSKSEFEPKKAYSFYINDVEKLKESASGGAAAALAEVVIENNGIVYACSYDDSFYDAQFSECDNTEKFREYKSSIYFNTQPMDQKAVKKIIESGRNCMVVGLPCQIAALRNFIGKSDKLLCVSLICGGQEPRTLHRKVLDEIMASHPGEDISGVNYRYKKKDWNTSCLKVSFKSGKHNLGGGAFRMDVLRRCCYHCNYKIDNSFSDIVIGDFWGSEMLEKEYHNKFGTSIALALTETGIAWMEKTSRLGTLREVAVADTYRTNKAIISCKKKNPNRDQIVRLWNDRSLFEVQKAVLGNRYYVRRLKYIIKGLLPDALVRTVKRLKNY